MVKDLTQSATYKFLKINIIGAAAITTASLLMMFLFTTFLNGIGISGSIKIASMILPFFITLFLLFTGIGGTFILLRWLIRKIFKTKKRSKPISINDEVKITENP